MHYSTSRSEDTEAKAVDRAASPDEPMMGGGSSGLEWAGEDGIATAEFAIVALAAVAFAGVLVTVLSSGDVSELLMGLVQKALSY